MRVIYPVIFTAKHDKKETYLVYIPDLDGATEGYGIEDAYNMARDYLGGALYEMKDEEIPPASDIRQIDVASGAFNGKGDSFVSLVDLDLEAYRRKLNKKTVRRNVSLPEWLNKAAEEAHLNVSRVLQEAIKEKLNITD